MVTVIIPVYNSADYLGKCIESIIVQTYRDLEIIVVDDGSTDGSGLIVDSYTYDERISVIHQDNHGLVYSRKQGILQAHGEYVLFVDSDDWITENAVEELVKLAKMNDAEVVASGAVKIYQDDKGAKCFEVAEVNIAGEGVYKKEKLSDLKQNLFCIEDYCSMALLPYLWNKLWRRELISQFVLEADEKITVGEDVAIGFSAILSSESVFVTNEAYYNYRQVVSSMMRKSIDEMSEFENANRLFSYLNSKCKELGCDGKVLEGLRRYRYNQLVTRAYSVINNLENSNGLFPFEDEMPSKLVIYGAGEFGKAVYGYASKKCSVKAWIDKNYEVYREVGYPVSSLEEYEIDKEDIVIVAVLRKKSIQAISDDLINKGFEPKNIHIIRNVSINSCIV